MNKQEERAWKETCDIMSNPETMNGIKISLQQIARGESIPLSELKI